MSLLFLDTSAVIKLYVREAGSNWLRRYVRNQQIAISELALFEAATVLRRRYVEGTFTRVQALGLLRRIRRGSTGYQVIKLGGPGRLDELIIAAFSLPNTFNIRALDALHLEAALEVSRAASTTTPPTPFIFITSDRQLLRVAQTQGFITENPEDHP